MPSIDREIRVALHRKKLRSSHSCDDTIVVDELGLASAQARIDVAVINGCVHGYEIKSERDTLERLPDQMAVYARCLEKLTVVCAEKHVRGVKKTVPAWAGIISVRCGPRGAIHFRTERRAKRNPTVAAADVAQILWRDEAAALLQRLGDTANLKRATRDQLYTRLGERLSPADVARYAREIMHARQTWRGRPTHARCGD
jgi:hypothetical protein